MTHIDLNGAKYQQVFTMRPYSEWATRFIYHLALNKDWWTFPTVWLARHAGNLWIFERYYLVFDVILCS